jgi:hypothetical protein
MARACVLVVAALVAVCVAAASVTAQPPGQRPLPSNYHMINPGNYKRDQQLACNDPQSNKPSCNAKCDKSYPNQSIVLCPGCKTLCSM